ncbi:MAG: heme-binding protein [Solirubrobacterales bacterium]
MERAARQSRDRPLQHVPRVVAVGGGFPLIDGDQVVGGLGISGGDYAQDQKAGETALGSVGFDLPG